MTLTEYLPTKIICLTPPENAPLELRVIEWVLATDKNGVNVIALKNGDYDKLSENTAKILDYLIKEDLIANHWQQCTIDHNEAVKNAGF